MYAVVAVAVVVAAAAAVVVGIVDKSDRIQRVGRVMAVVLLTKMLSAFDYAVLESSLKYNELLKVVQILQQDKEEVSIVELALHMWVDILGLNTAVVVAAVAIEVKGEWNSQEFR